VILHGVSIPIRYAPPVDFAHPQFAESRPAGPLTPIGLLFWPGAAASKKGHRCVRAGDVAALFAAISRFHCGVAVGAIMPEQQGLCEPNWKNADRGPRGPHIAHPS